MVQGKERGPAAEVPPGLLEGLEAIYRLHGEGAAVTPDALRRRLGLGEATVLERVLALQGRGLVRGEPSGRLELTDEGRRLALGLVRKHRLVERFCVDLLGLPWEQVHDEARRLTPVLSDAVAEALHRLLGAPATCPHGNPIPSADGTLQGETGVPLHRLRPGQSAIILRIEREERELLRYLATLGLLPQTKVEVEEVAPFGGPLLIRVGDARYALGRKVAAKIRVREA